MYKGLTSLLIQNLKVVMSLWTLILGWCSTFSFLFKMRL